jgi:hypothetical protein
MRAIMATGSWRGRAGSYLNQRWARIRKTPLAAEVIAVAAGLGIAAGLWIGLGPGGIASGAGYHVSEVTTETFAPQYAREPVVTMREQGAFDPVSHVGEETLPLHPELPAVSEIRYVGKYVYEYLTDQGQGGSDGKSWDQLLAPPPSFPSENNENSVVQNGLANVPDDMLGGPVTPYNLLTVLKSLGTVREDGPVSGPGWTGTKYSFSGTVEDFITASGHPPARPRHRVPGPAGTGPAIRADHRRTTIVQGP